MNIKWDTTIPLVQGETHVSNDARTVVSTVLGSCISMCLFDPDLRVGGINHFLLADSASHNPNDNKYGLFAFETLLNEIMKRGGYRSSIKAKVFGGACMRGKFAELGPRNAAFARDILAAEGIECVGHDTGGYRARRVKFHPVTGHVKMAIVPAFEQQESAPVFASNTRGANVELF